MYYLFGSEKRKLHSDSTNCISCACAAFCQQTNPMCWEQPWLGAAGHPVAPQGQWLMAQWYCLAPKRCWLSCCSSEWPWTGDRFWWQPQGCGWGKAGLPCAGHSPRLTAGPLRGKGVEEPGEKMSLGKGVDGSKVVVLFLSQHPTLFQLAINYNNFPQVESLFVLKQCP